MTGIKMTAINTVIITAALLIGASQLAMAQSSQGTPGSSGPPASGSSQGSSGPPAGSSGAVQGK
jgi:hypothetical protein